MSKYPSDIDTEIVPFLDAFNSIPSVHTLFSCCGHGERSWYVSAKVKDIHVLHTIIQRFSRIGDLQFKFTFFDDAEAANELDWNFGIYSEVLGKSCDFMRKHWEDWLVIQCDKIKKILNEEKNVDEDDIVEENVEEPRNEFKISPLMKEAIESVNSRIKHTLCSHCAECGEWSPFDGCLFEGSCCHLSKSSSSCYLDD